MDNNRIRPLLSTLSQHKYTVANQMKAGSGGSTDTSQASGSVRGIDG